MIGLIGAMPVEVEQLMGLLENRKEEKIGMDTFVSGVLFGQEAVLAICGPGKVNAALCAQSMILRYQPEWVLNLGVAGAGEEGVNIGDMVVATCAVQHDMDASGFGYRIGQIPRVDTFAFEADEKLRELAIECNQKVNPEIQAFPGRVVSGDQFISDKAKKEWLIEQFSASCTEMEGAAIAQAAYLNGIPFLIIRAISDKADDSAGMDYAAFEAQAIKHSVNLLLEMASRYEA